MFVSIAITIITNISLIYFYVPSFVYLNIAGVFIFTIYFGLFKSLIFILITQLIMVRFGQTMNFLDYTLISNMVCVAIICFVYRAMDLMTKNIVKVEEKTSCKILFENIIYIFVCIVILSILVRFISLFIFKNISEDMYYAKYIFDIKLLYKDFQIYGFSGVIALVYLTIMQFWRGKNEIQKK